MLPCVATRGKPSSSITEIGLASTSYSKRGSRGSGIVSTPSGLWGRLMGSGLQSCNLLFNIDPWLVSQEFTVRERSIMLPCVATQGRPSSSITETGLGVGFYTSKRSLGVTVSNSFLFSPMRIISSNLTTPDFSSIICISSASTRPSVIFESS